jgi:hypothetical protein
MLLKPAALLKTKLTLCLICTGNETLNLCLCVAACSGCLILAVRLIHSMANTLAE